MKPFLFIFSFVAVIFFSSCEGDEYVTYRFTSLDLKNADSSPGMPMVINSDSIRNEVYVLRLNLHPVEVSRKGRYFDTYESSVRAINPIVKIKITSSDSFDIMHPAGSNMNNYFVYLAGNYMHVSEPIEYDGTIAPTAKYNEDYAENNFPEYADLLLIHPPDNLVYRKFYVELTIKDEGIWKDSTTLIKLY